MDRTTAEKKPLKRQAIKQSGKIKSFKKTTNLELIFLGGLGEIGKNMLLLETDDQLFVIDAGLMFPTDETPGVDLILPDLTYLLEKKHKVKAIFLTHGHEDHIGAVPYILREIKVPIYGSKLTLGLLKTKLEEHGLKADLREVNEKSRVQFGNLRFEFIPQIHSIPDGFALAIHTPLGIILHTGDFKFDTSPLPGQRVYYERLTELAKKGVKVLLSDSTNADETGITPPEKTVSERLKEIFSSARRKVIVASFASHIHRIQNIFDAAKNTGRLVAVSGRSMRQSIQVALKTGHLQIDEKQLIDLHNINDYPPHQVCILCTGSQGEPLSALSLIASREHSHIKIEPGDTVVIAASPIPGNERRVSNIINSLLKLDAEVYYSRKHGVHVSGHASQEELKLLINMVKPEYFVPIHGEFRHLVAHARVAAEAGVKKENIFLVENGQALKMTPKGLEVSHKVAAGVTYVDGLMIGDIERAILIDRENLAKSGIIFVVAAIDEYTKEIVYGPDIITRGLPLNDQILNQARERVNRKVRQYLMDEEIIDFSLLRKKISDSVLGFVYEKTKKKPVVIPFVFEV
jgi:ribonuclease J